jgi:ethanolamine ammonia-lyase small subunit
MNKETRKSPEARDIAIPASGISAKGPRAATSGTGTLACAPSDAAPIPPLSLTAYTAARVQLQQSGHSLATTEVLNLQLANAQARDAVHARLDVSALIAGLTARAIAWTGSRDAVAESAQAGVPVLLTSAATTRADYLRNPSLGRTLSADSMARLKTTVESPANSDLKLNFNANPAGSSSYDIAFVIADGLSALAVDRHALPLLDSTLALLDPAWRSAPICIVEQARVAIADPIGQILGAKISVILIGERPGLSSPDSLGVYITWNPRPGRTDADRNCISNIRPEGLSYQEAAKLLHFYLTESRRLQRTGTLLKPSTPRRILAEQQ